MLSHFNLKPAKMYQINIKVLRKEVSIKQGKEINKNKKYQVHILDKMN